MFNLKCMKGSGRGEYYLNLTKDDHAQNYYLKRSERDLVWCGSGAEQIGYMEGSKVEEAPFMQILKGQTPDGKGVKNKGEDRVSGFDGIFNVGKRISTFYSQADEAVQKVIEEAVMSAARKCLYHLEDVAGYTRRGAGGGMREKVGLIAAQTLHLSARITDGAPPDPHLHVHTWIANVAKCADGSTRTLSGELLFREQKSVGALFRAELAKQLVERLGLEVQREGWKVDLKGPDSLTALANAFSHRRHEIEAELKKRGANSAKAAEQAALSTRKPKERMSIDELQPLWLAEGERCGFSRHEASKLLGRAREKDRARELEAAVGSTVELLTEEHATFTARDVVRVLAEESAARGLGVEEIREAAGKLMQSGEMVPLGLRAGEVQATYTTRTNLILEESVEKTAVQLSNTKATCDVSERSITSVLEKNSQLNEGQRGAVRHICGAGRFSIVVGRPGTGKSTLLSAVRKVLEKNGFELIGATISAKAARGLEESSGIKSYTLAKLIGSKALGIRGDFEQPSALEGIAQAGMESITGPRRGSPGKNKVVLKPNSCLVVDEAGMCGSRTMSKILQHAERVGCKVVFVGDPLQLQPIGEAAASPLRHLANRCGAVTLNEVIRQEDVLDRKAIESFAELRIAESLRSFAQRGKITVVDSKEEAKERLVKLWKKGAIRSPSDTLVFTRTRTEAKEINLRCQMERLTAGELGSGIKVDDTVIYKNDRVMFLRNSRYYRVNNGSLGTVKEVSVLGRRVTVELDGGARVSVPLDDYKHLALAYAITTHKGQGVSVKRSLVLASDKTTRELAFVQLSRHKSEVSLVVDKEQAGEKLGQLIQAMSRSEEKKTALQVQREIQLER